MFGKVISDMMIKPGKSPVFETPDKYNLPFEDVTFKTSDDITLSGWLINGNTDKVIIQSHFGVQCSRCGFTQEGKGMMKNALWTSDIHFLDQAKYLFENGYSVLMYDMRNHGNSEQTDWVSWGVKERKDIVAAIKYISDKDIYKDASIGLLSICMGQGATTFAFGMEEEMKSFNQLKAMISVQPLTYDFFVKAMGLPNFLINSGNKYNKEKRNTDLTGEAFLPYVKDIFIPTLVIQNKNDPMTNLNMVQEYYNSLTVEKDLLWLDLEKKRGAAYSWLGKNPDPILNWFNKYL
ncbi:alpha/beta hydrolase [Flammeovirga agarivorans]|uniref:Alpha/beta hydrolase n=1 Tax=Flammeovirga agarivorans TaxID=2726742 RepID=A0A7X8SP57_9BACT|nr:alpha/beta hydrolase [Flammeovirga agarivorans]NLR93831.1 alpha/beta hydrolase [Flammeovirga agarivorans]